MKKILFIDDDESNLISLKANLKFHFKVYTTSNTDINFIKNLISENGIDIIISDERMPYINGSDLIKNLKKLFPKLTYILTSGYIDNISVNKLKENKIIDYYFEKPWDINSLINSISSVGIKYNRIAIIDSDSLSNILNTKIIRNNLKDVIVYDFTDINQSISFLSKHSVDLIIIKDDLYELYGYILKKCQKDTSLYILTDEIKNPLLKNYITNPILKSNTHLIEMAICQTN